MDTFDENTQFFNLVNQLYLQRQAVNNFNNDSQFDRHLRSFNNYFEVPLTYHLQRLVDGGAWRNNLLLKQHIYRQYLDLLSKGVNVENFGSVEFWEGIENCQSGSGQVHPPSHYYQIEEVAQPLYARRFSTERHRFRVIFTNTDQLTNAPEQLEAIFDDILRHITANLNDGSMGIEIRHPSLDRPIYIPLSKSLNGLKILNAILRVIQSKTELKIDEHLEIITVSVQLPAGSGSSHKRRSVTCNLELWMKSHTGHGGCFIPIKNNNKDHSCLARAIVVARARIHKDDPNSTFKYKSVIKGDQGHKTSEQKRQANALMEQAGLGNQSGPCGIFELEKIQAVMPNYQIKVLSIDAKGPIFIGKVDNAKHIIHLMLKDSHYTVISSITEFFASNYYCDSCNKPFNNKSDHRCAVTCKSCYARPACPRGNYPLLCSDCNRYFNNKKCFENHKRVYQQKGSNKRQKTGSSICDRIKRCPTCSEHIRRANKEPHKCGHFKCRTCKKLVEKENHLCYMQKLGVDGEVELDDDDDGNEEDKPSNSGGLGDKEEEPPIFVFYDFECTQEKEISAATFQHQPNLCVVHIVCDECRQNLDPCERCGEHRKVFKGPQCLENFAKWLFSNTKRNITAIAHNSKGYDGQFIMNYLQKNGITPKIVNKGLELMSISVGKVRLIDSLNFMPMALSALPKAFGIEELAKGWFPHHFNKAENWKYIGPWPEQKYYSPESMKADMREKFEKWHTEQQGKVFNFQAEIQKYCESDVDILRRCSLEFRDIFMAKTGVDPFGNSLTIAGACNKVFRTNFLEPDTIGLVPHGGYRKKEKQSIVALKWLKWISHKDNVQIKHAQNGPEQKIGKFKVDGLAGKVVYEYNGCFWHGCPRCMTNDNHRTADASLSAKAAYERTIERRLFIESQGFMVIEMWDCQLQQQLAQDHEMQEFFDSLEIMEPMDPREAFFGGRTNAVKLYDCITYDENGEPLERIDYTDICSLYPFICKYGAFPKGHPQIITENFLSLDSEPYDGLIKCKILPPQDLYNPLLPYRSNKKLTFPLCSSCADQHNTGVCKHTDNERAITGAWVSLEVYEAIHLGYKVLEIYEVWHYVDVEQYDRDSNPDGGLFTGYINEFIQMKQADGWPGWVETEEDKDRYVQEYEDYEGVRLNPSNIKKNPGLRALAKLMLNSFWGKFGQRNNMGKVEYFTEPEKYFRHIHEAGRIIHAINIVSDNMVAVTSTFEEEFVDILPNTNPVIAAYTTAQARLKLYSYIEQLGERVLYFDTDSIIYKTRLDKPNQYKVPIGSYLGFMTDELEKDYGAGSYITEFVSGGPKSYSYKTFSTRDQSEHCNIKVKGFSLTSEISKLINFDCLKNLVFEFVNNDVVQTIPVKFSKIERTRDHDVVTKPAQKKYRVVYDKRVIMKDFSTIPYGYKNSNLDDLLNIL